MAEMKTYRATITGDGITKKVTATTRIRVNTTDPWFLDYEIKAAVHDLEELYRIPCRLHKLEEVEDDA